MLFVYPIEGILITHIVRLFCKILGIWTKFLELLTMLILRSLHNYQLYNNRGIKTIKLKLTIREVVKIIVNSNKNETKPTSFIVNIVRRMLTLLCLKLIWNDYKGTSEQEIRKKISYELWLSLLYYHL